MHKLATALAAITTLSVLAAPAVADTGDDASSSGLVNNTIIVNKGNGNTTTVTGRDNVSGTGHVTGQEHSVGSPIPVLCGSLDPNGPVPRGYNRIVGTEGPDTLTGTAGDDIILGLGGNDTLNGLAGNDILCGGEGNDVLDGGLGNNFNDGGFGSNICTNPSSGRNVLNCGT